MSGVGGVPPTTPPRLASPRVTGRARSLGGPTHDLTHACKPQGPRGRVPVGVGEGLAYRHHPRVHSPRVRGKDPALCEWVGGVLPTTTPTRAQPEGQQEGPGVWGGRCSVHHPAHACKPAGSAGKGRCLEGPARARLRPPTPAHACAARPGVGLRRGRGRPRGPAGMRGREGGARPRTGRRAIQWAPGTVGSGQSGRGGGAASLWAGPGRIPRRLKRGRVRGAQRDGGRGSRQGECGLAGRGS